MSEFNRISRKRLAERVEALEQKKKLLNAPASQVELRDRLKSSLFEFTRYFYKIRTGREYANRPGQSRPSFLDSILPVLESTIDNPANHCIMINCPPRYGKTELLLNYIAWSLAIYPDSNFMYVSYSATLASEKTKTLREIITLKEYGDLFGIYLRSDSRAKDRYKVNTGGEICSAGAGGTITGFGAGLPDVDRFGGALLIDDIHKPNEAASEVARDNISNWYHNTLASRVNNARSTPKIFIGQRVHEYDQAARLLNGEDDYPWAPIVLPALDSAKNALMPSMHTKSELLKKQETEPYVFASQYQQEPTAAGNTLFKQEYFYPLQNIIPENIELTFLTVDTAETDKTYNDATVFSFWGIYKTISGLYNLHWIDCVQTWVEPKNLQTEFMAFYTECCRFKIKPSMIAIEKKSTGATLQSTLGAVPGLHVLPIERTVKSGSKANRYIEMQSPIACKRLTLTLGARHTKMCIDHMIKITPNDTHRRDDICDTAYDAVRLALIDKTMSNFTNKSVDNKAYSHHGSNLIDTSF